MFPNIKELSHESVITNIVLEGEASDKLAKLDDVFRVERKMERIDPNFKGFYMDVPCPHRIRKMITNHA